MRRAPVGRALVVALALGGALAVPLLPVSATTSPCSPSNPCLAVHLPDDSVNYVDISTIRADSAAAQSQSNGVPDGTNYPQLTSAGTDPGPVTVSDAVSVNALIAPMLAELSPPIAMSSVTFTDMPKPGEATWSILPAADLSARPSAFADPNLLPAYYSELGTNAIWYVRPLLNDTDTNTDDNAVTTTTPANGELDLYVHTGPLLAVTAKASAQTVKIGQPITFTSSSSGTSAKVTYTWTLSSGQQLSTHQSFTYSFPAAGIYELQVAATGTDDSAGTATPIFISVGKTRYSGSPSPGTSSTPTPTGTPTPAATPTPTVTPLPTATQSAPAVTPTSPAAGTTSGRAGGAAKASQPPSSSPSESRHRAGRLTVVRGRLIGQTAALSTTPGSVADQQSLGVSPATRLSKSWRAVALVGSIAAIMLLFVAGAARELRWSRRGRSAVRPR